ncbi:prorelaxin H1 [Stigmatopora nigra]
MESVRKTNPFREKTREGKKKKQRSSAKVSGRMFWNPVACVLALALVAYGGEVVRSRDYGVKLCGREFIRAVIFTCGGSRWKRFDVVKRDSLDWSPHHEEQPAIIHLQNFLDQNEPGRLDALGALARLQRGIGTRGRRYFSGGVASACCAQGCTRNDIGRLC